MILMFVLYVIRNHPVYMYIYIFIVFKSRRDSNVSCTDSVSGGLCGLENATCSWNLQLKAAMMEFRKVFFLYPFSYLIHCCINTTKKHYGHRATYIKFEKIYIFYLTVNVHL